MSICQIRHVHLVYRHFGSCGSGWQPTSIVFVRLMCNAHLVIVFSFRFRAPLQAALTSRSIVAFRCNSSLSPPFSVMPSYFADPVSVLDAPPHALGFFPHLHAPYPACSSARPVEVVPPWPLLAASLRRSPYCAFTSSYKLVQLSSMFLCIPCNIIRQPIVHCKVCTALFLRIMNPARHVRSFDTMCVYLYSFRCICVQLSH